MSKRIYVVTPEIDIVLDDKPQISRLVRAKTQAEAIRHVVGNLYTCAVADTETVAHLAGDGVKVEDAKEK